MLSLRTLVLAAVALVLHSGAVAEGSSDGPQVVPPVDPAGNPEGLFGDGMMSEDEQIDFLFSSIDGNSDDELDKKELYGFFAMAGPGAELSEEQRELAELDVAEFLRDADKDHSESISKDEFNRLIRAELEYYDEETNADHWMADDTDIDLEQEDLTDFVAGADGDQSDANEDDDDDDDDDDE
eukprot:Clim_evm19s242 gene=Clim_evmTU19s242